MKIFPLLLLILLSTACYSQDQKITIDNFSTDGYNKGIVKEQKVDLDYSALTSYAEKMFLKRNYRAAIDLYNQAFKQNIDSGKISDRYKLASSYAQLGINDSAFIQLYRIYETEKYSSSEILCKDENFIRLHTEPNWDRLIKIIDATEIKKKY